MTDTTPPTDPTPADPTPATGEPATTTVGGAPTTPAPAAPLYKGEPLDAERGPGLGCFYVQVVVLGALLVFTPLTVIWSWDPAVSAGLLILTLLLLLFAGQTVIFLLRLVAADRRTRRRPLSSEARRTVGQLEDEARPAADAASDVPATPDAPSGDDRPA